ncbi:MAG TPA: rod shape-determining protein MreC [Acidimicrobiia bacterium]|jgi:rod shape-determining protein MreC|nr:rod shape-determining protein MreC [Acidimicrobiia bacterium]
MAGPGRGGRRRYVLVLLVLTAVTLITLDQRQGDSGAVGTLGRVAHRVVDPVSNVASDIMSPVSNWFDGIVHAGSLKHDNARLRRELAAARVQAAQGHADRSENRQLNALLHLSWGGDPIPSVVASVIDNGAGNFNRTITLSRGTESGVRVGMPVVASGGLVGRVWQSWSGGSTVLLLDDPDFAVGVRMVTHRNVGIAGGQAGRSTLSVPLAGPLNAHARPRRSEIVITSGQTQSTFPPGIPVGRVVSTSVSDDGLTIDTLVAPYVDVGSLEYVRVLQWKPGSAVPPKLQSSTTVPTTTTTTTTPTTLPGATTTSSSTPPTT